MESCDAVVLTKTWLTHDVVNEELLTTRYMVYVHDLDRDMMGKNRGGILIALKQIFKSCKIDICLSNLSTEILCIKLERHRGGTLYVFCVYISPQESNQLSAELFAFLESLESIMGSEILII